MNSARISRRHFIRSTVKAGAIAASTPMILPAPVLGRQGWTRPSEQIRMGFIGVGTQGGGHLLGGAWTYVAGRYARRKDGCVPADCGRWIERRGRARQRVNDQYAAGFRKGKYEH